MSDASAKLVHLREILGNLGKIAVAYSGGADSTLLLMVARNELGTGASAIIASGDLFPSTELEEATARARAMGIEPYIVRTDLMASPSFRSNPLDRCYICKRAIFTEMIGLAQDRGLGPLADGSHTGDRDEDRPGRRALRELGVLSPLTEAGFDKPDVRACSELLGLPTARKPASPCLATRIPFHEEITIEKLRQVDQAERAVRDLGIEVVRVRHHGPMARIEVPLKDVQKVVSSMESLTIRFRSLGFARVEVDPRGYRSGSLSEAAALREKR